MAKKQVLRKQKEQGERRQPVLGTATHKSGETHVVLVDEDGYIIDRIDRAPGKE